MSEKVYPALFQNRQSGSMRMSENGVKYEITVKSTGLADMGIIRAYAETTTGQRVLVGVMQPLENGLYAHKVFSKLSLATAGIDPAALSQAVLEGLPEDGRDGGERPEPGAPPARKQSAPALRKTAEETESMWTPLGKSRIFLRDRFVSAAARRSKDILVRRHLNGALLAAPMEKETPFAFSFALSVTRPVMIQGKSHGAVYIDKNGRLSPWPEEIKK